MWSLIRMTSSFQLLEKGDPSSMSLELVLFFSLLLCVVSFLLPFVFFMYLWVHVSERFWYFYIWSSRAIGLMSRAFTNGPGDQGSILGRIIPKTQKLVLDATLLNTQHYRVSIKGKLKQSREGVAPSSTPWCSNYWKGSLQVTLD